MGVVKMNASVLYAVQLTDNMIREMSQGRDPHKVIPGSNLYGDLKGLRKILGEIGRAYCVAEVCLPECAWAVSENRGSYKAIKGFPAKFVPLEQIANA